MQDTEGNQNVQVKINDVEKERTEQRIVFEPINEPQPVETNEQEKSIGETTESPYQKIY